LVGSQTAYRLLASKLRLKNGTTIMSPIVKLLANIIPSPIWSTSFAIDALDTASSKKTFSVSAWHVVSVESEIAAELNSLGKSVKHGGQFKARHMGGRDGGRNAVWISFGGDAGGTLGAGTFKFGAIVLNRANPLSPLNVVVLSLMRGAKDNHDNLVRTALRPEFTKQIDDLKDTAVCRVTTANKIESTTYAESSVLFVPKRLLVASDHVYGS